MMSNIITAITYLILASLLFFVVYEGIKLHFAHNQSNIRQKLNFLHKKINTLGELITSDARVIMSPLSQRVCLLKIKKLLLVISSIHPSVKTRREINSVDKHLLALPNNYAHYYDEILRPKSESALKQMISNIFLLISVLKQDFLDGMLEQSIYMNEVKELKKLATRLRLEVILENANECIKNERPGLAIMQYNSAIILLSSAAQDCNYTIKMKALVTNLLDSTKDIQEALLTDTKRFDQLTKDRQNSSDKYHESGQTNMDDKDMIFNKTKMYYNE